MPVFTNVGGPCSDTGPGTIAEPWCTIENGAFLTNTISGGENNTEMQVQDANYFTDGFGVVEGDWIQIEGKTTPVQIHHVDYSTHTINLRSPHSWDAGSGVSLPYSGSRPDQGSFEFRE